MPFGFSHIFVMNADGVGYYIDEGVHRDQKDEEFFELVMTEDALKTDPFYFEDGTPIMTLSVPIRNTNGERVGGLCGAVRLTSIQQIIINNEMLLEGECFILDSKGTYITHTDDQKVKYKVSVFDTPNSKLGVIEQAIENKKDARGNIILEGVEYTTYVTYLDDYKWLAVQMIPVSSITTLYSSLSIIQFILGFFVAMLIFCMIRIILRWEKSNSKIYTDTLTNCNSRAACYDFTFKELWRELGLVLKEKSKLLDFEYEITSSYGLATRTKGEQTSLHTILQLADERMYEYKTRMKQVK